MIEKKTAGSGYSNLASVAPFFYSVANKSANQANLSAGYVPNTGTNLTIILNRSIHLK